MRILIAALLAFLTCFSTVHANADDRTTQIGAAAIDITPGFPVRLTGYGNRRDEATEVAQPIWAKAIAIGGDGEAGPAVWITVENCGITPTIRKAVATQLEAQGVKNHRLAISVTHTHTAPCLTNWAPYIFRGEMPDEHQAHIDQYTAELPAKLVEVARQAIANRRTGTLSWGQGKVGFAVNRRVLKDGAWTGFGVQPDGPVDHSLPILVAKDLDDKLIAIVANYACHCTTLGGRFNQIAGDWAGFAQEYLEKDHPGAIGLISIGCGADANPEPRRDDLDVCRQHGRALADEVNRLLSTELTPLDPQLVCQLQHIDLPFAELPTKEQWEQTAKRNDTAGYHASQFLKRIAAGEEISETLSYPVATWRFGDDLAIVMLAGEVVVDYSIRLKEALDDKRLWITAYTNDVPCYIPSKRILREGGYEADHSMLYYARPTRFAPEVEDLIADEVQKQLPPRFYSAQLQQAFPPAKSPQEALASITTRPGYIVELVAAEPLIEDPVAFDWGPDGRLWVVEMRGYPNGVAWNRVGDPLDVSGGRVKVLDDDDGDGRYDRATVFLDNIPYPTGIKVWRDGILVTAAPEIFYAEDTDGDDVADHRETLYSGFGEGNQQHRVNCLRWGLDHWLHIGNGDSSGNIKSLKTGELVNIGGRDLRIRPDDGAMQTQTGRTQFGRCRDDFGNWFGGNNSNPMWHNVLDDQYLRRNPHFAPPATTRQIAERPGAAPVFPTSRTLARFNDFDRVNRFTSACSPMIFRDRSLVGTDDRQFAYVCEPVHNLVHRSVLEPDGVSFRSYRADGEKQSEFFASTDNWSRPAMVREGPDGAIWIADMYRFVIEHPQWVPLEWQRKIALRAGSDKGRIYRVRIPGIPNTGDWRKSQLPKLDHLDTAALVAQLDTPNGTKRDMVQQLLYWRHDEASIEPLKKVMRDAVWSQAALPALYLLDDLDAIDDEFLLFTLNQGSASIRRHAIRLAESRVNTSPRFGDSFVKWANGPYHDQAASQHVKLQLAYSLGEWNDPRAADALAMIALQARDNIYITAAVMSSLNEKNVGGVLARVLQDDSPPASLVGTLVGQAIAMQDMPSVGRAITYIASSAKVGKHWRMSVIADILGTLERRSKHIGDVLQGDASEQVAQLFDNARQIAADVSANETDRLLAMRLLGHEPNKQDDDVAILSELLTPLNSSKVQSAATAAIGSLGGDDAPSRLLAHWNSKSPSVRAEILDLLTRDTGWTKQLLAAIQRGDVPASSIDARRRQQFARHKDASIRDQAATLFAMSTVGRQQVLDQYQGSIGLSGNRVHGKIVFEKQCSKCHRLENVGHVVGPDLSALTDKTPAAMLVAILDPNRAVEDKFLDFAAITDDGRQHSGMIGVETSNSVTLVGQEGKQTVILRNQIEEFISTGKSMMPEGLEKELKPQDVADVIAYVRGVTQPPKQFAGNEPQVAPMRDDGSIRLFAIHARIYGPSLVFEQKYRNLGFWQSTDDHAIWKLNVPQAGTYDVRIDYACPNDAAGNRYEMFVAGQSLGGVIQGSGGWARFRGDRVGNVELPQGEIELLIRSDGAIRGSLMDLRTIRLYPQ